MTPPGWATRTENGRTEYMLALFAPTAEEAEAMSVAEAHRHIVEFAEVIAAWMSGDARTMPESRQDYYKAMCGVPDERRPHFDQWLSEQIVAMAKGDRKMPEGYV